MSDTTRIIIAAGVGTFLLRYIPFRHTLRMKPRAQIETRGAWRVFFTFVGPAAIASLLAASLAPDIKSIGPRLFAAVAGLTIVVLIKRSVGGFAMATLAGAIAYGLARTVFGY